MSNKLSPPVAISKVRNFRESKSIKSESSIVVELGLIFRGPFKTVPSAVFIVSLALIFTTASDEVPTAIFTS